MGMRTPYAPRVMVGAWVAAGWAGIAYGAFLNIDGAAFAAGCGADRAVVCPAASRRRWRCCWRCRNRAPVVRERRWLMLALLFSAVGDVLLAIPSWAPSFVLGLASFLLAHLCFSRCAAASGARVTAVGSVADPLDRRGVDVRGLPGAAGVVLAAAGS